MASEKIYSAIIGVMGDIGAVTKDQRNTQGIGYMFRGIDQVYNALQPALVKHGVFPIPIVEDEERMERVTNSGSTLLYSRLKVRYRFCAEDGSFVEAKVVGEAMDTGDKATNKALSAAFKYACFQMFCIPTEEAKDSEDNTYEVAPNVPPEQEPQLDATQILVNQNHINTIKTLMKKKGVKEEMILARYHRNSINEMTMFDFARALKAFEKMPDQTEQLSLGL